MKIVNEYAFIIFKKHLSFEYWNINKIFDDVAPEITQNITGLLGADKGYIRPELTSYYQKQGIDLQTPLKEYVW